MPPDRDPFSTEVAETIQTHGMIREGDTVLVGLSGGPDSVALVRVLLGLQSELGIRLGLAHLNHLLRGEESFRDEHFVQNLSDKLGLPLFRDRQNIHDRAVETKTSTEEAGREARYAFFRRIARNHGFSRVALGHNRDDNSEQVLLSLVRGAGPTGLRGILPVRDPLFIRPLIRMPRIEILDFLGRIHQNFVLDSSNENPVFLRNRVRHALIPYLETSFNPRIRDALDRLSQIIQEEEDFFQEQTRKGFLACLKEETSSYVTLSSRKLQRLHPALASRVLRMTISRVKTDLRKISMDHIRGIRTFMARAQPGKHLDLPGRIRVYQNHDGLTIKKEEIPLRTLGRDQKQQGRLSRKGGRSKG